MAIANKNDEITPYHWQEPHISAVESSLLRFRVCIDTSSTGAGKTITSLLVAKRMRRPVVLVVTVSVLEYWQDWARRIGVDVIACVNYELLLAQTRVSRHYYDCPPKCAETARAKRRRVRLSRTWNPDVHPPESRKIQHQAVNIARHPNSDNMLGGWQSVNTEWRWLHDQFLDPGTDPLFIFDEAHKMGGATSKYSRFLKAAKDQGILTLLLSATIADSPLRMRGLGYLTGLFKSWSSQKYKAWCLLHGCDYLDLNKLTFTGDDTDIDLIKGELGEKLQGINTGDIPGFPLSNIVILSITTDPQALNEEYAKALDAMIDDAETEAVASMRARQLSEWLKRDWILSKTQDLIEEGMSVCIFVSFKATGEFLSNKLKCDFICGETKGERGEQIRRFQANEIHVIVIMCQAGGESISLHDLHGRPRATIISPNHKATELVQVFGRTPRAGSKQASVTQYVIFAKGCPAEGRVRRNLRMKTHNIQLLTDNDLSIMPKKISNERSC